MNAAVVGDVVLVPIEGGLRALGRVRALETLALVDLYTPLGTATGAQISVPSNNLERLIPTVRPAILAGDPLFVKNELVVRALPAGTVALVQVTHDVRADDVRAFVGEPIADAMVMFADVEDLYAIGAVVAAIQAAA